MLRGSLFSEWPGCLDCTNSIGGFKIKEVTIKQSLYLNGIRLPDILLIEAAYDFQIPRTKSKIIPIRQDGDCLRNQREGICLHFRFTKIEDRLGQALAGNAHPRCI